MLLWGKSNLLTTGLAVFLAVLAFTVLSSAAGENTEAERQARREKFDKDMAPARELVSEQLRLEAQADEKLGRQLLSEARKALEQGQAELAEKKEAEGQTLFKSASRTYALVAKDLRAEAQKARKRGETELAEKREAQAREALELAQRPLAQIK